MGSPRCVFYVVHYSTKSTQKDDRGADYDRIGQQVMKRIAKERARVDAEMNISRQMTESSNQEVINHGENDAIIHNDNNAGDENDDTINNNDDNNENNNVLLNERYVSFTYFG